jgi:hypothetical protein
VTDLGNRLDGGPRHLHSGEMLLDLAPMEMYICVISSFLSTLRLEFEFSFDNYGAITARKWS